MIELKVQKFGDVLTVTLPAEVITRLQIGDGEPVFLVEELDGSHRLTSRRSVVQRKLLKAGEIVGRYRNALNKLSK
ncbi:MAG TPA: hypothetical protein VLA02_13695 [Reyranella sp.]|nr:hypothetical protein [Reyranella sp.]